jgi:ATP-binding cassette subfamily E protein 1
VFLAGFVPTENLRFREDALSFKVSERADELVVGDREHASYNYPTMTRVSASSVSCLSRV